MAQVAVQVPNPLIGNTPLPPAIAVVKNDSSQNNTQVIAFNRVGNLIVIQATADTTTGNFILDTGAPGLVLNLTYFRQYKQSEAGDRGSVSGAVLGAAQTIIDKFSFGDVSYKSLEADMINLGHIEDRKGINYTFRLKGAPKAKSVFLAGDFNNWAPASLSMQKQGDDWICSVYLSAGKHKYKFVVDGAWITDPANKNWEQNEFGTGNSVVWVEK